MIEKDNLKFAVCVICEKNSKKVEIKRKDMNTTGMRKHLKTVHSDLIGIINAYIKSN